jgi:LPS export ABC transporter protein LptC
MLRLVSLMLLTLAAAVVAYLPYTQQGAKLVPQQTQLQIEMTHIAGMITDRHEQGKNFRFHSEQLRYDEAQNRSTLTPYHFVGTSAGNYFYGDSLQATLHGDQFELNQNVVLKQATTAGETRTLTSQKLIMNIQRHTLLSPEAVRVSDNKQTIQADSLQGNYEEGNYEFTHHVQSHWQ